MHDHAWGVEAEILNLHLCAGVSYTTDASAIMVLKWSSIVHGGGVS